MGKVLRTAAVVIGAVAVGVATAGVLAPAATAAALGSIGVTATAASVATVLGAASGVLGFAGGLLSKKPSAAATGSQTQFAADPQAFIPLVIGRTNRAGFVVPRELSP